MWPHDQTPKCDQFRKMHGADWPPSSDQRPRERSNPAGCCINERNLSVAPNVVGRQLSASTPAKCYSLATIWHNAARYKAIRCGGLNNMQPQPQPLTQPRPQTAVKLRKSSFVVGLPETANILAVAARRLLSVGLLACCRLKKLRPLNNENQMQPCIKKSAKELQRKRIE